MKAFKQGEGWNVRQIQEKRESKTGLFNGIRDSRGMTLQERGVLNHLANYGSGGKEIFPGIIRLAEELEVSEWTVKRHLKALRVKGYLKKTGKRGYADEYEITLSSQAAPITTEEEVEPPPGDTHNGHHAPYERGLPPVTPGPRTDGWTPPNISYTELTRRVDRPGPGQDMYRAYSAFVAIKRGEGLTDMRQIAQLWREQNQQSQL